MKKIHLFPVLALLVQACSTAQPTAATEIPTIEASTILSEAPTAAAGTLVHLSVPTGGTNQRIRAHDNENRTTFESKKVITGDDFFKNRFERPFTSNEMAYVPDVDIVDFSITSDDTFFYILISLAGLDESAHALNGSYGIEIDRDRDGRAEMLLATQPPYDTEFTADNVFVYLDLDGDVGGRLINRPDGDYNEDGYEAVIFDLKRGVYPKDDPDLAWVRQTMDGDLPAVEIAYKRWIFQDGREQFLWSVLASSAEIDPTQLYWHDNFTAEQAGAANTDDPNYPVKELAEVDNTCRVPLGFEALGSEPLGCLVAVPDSRVVKEPDPDSTPGQFVSLMERVTGRFILLPARPQ